jgi:hypothetical protein
VKRRALYSLVWTLLASGCVPPASHPLPATPESAAGPAASPAAPGGDPILRSVCARDDQLRTLVSRFTSTVHDPQGTRTAEGVLLVKQPGALRFKLFTFAGLTVYDAIWVGDAHAARGVVRLPLQDRSVVLELDGAAGSTAPATDDRAAGSAVTAPAPDDRGAAAPEVQLSYALWMLWQPRCARPPLIMSLAAERAPSGAASPEMAGGSEGAPAITRLALDPASAHAQSRTLLVEGDEVREETLYRRPSADAPATRIIARYSDYDQRLPVPLARRVELVDEALGVRASVRVLSAEENGELDPGLFTPPAAAGEARAP